MKTANLIQAETNILKITSLHEGDTVKILEKEYNDRYKTTYGVVTALYNTGEKSFVEFSLYEKSYSKIEAKIMVYDGSTDLNIFPANPTEVQIYLQEAIASIEDSVKEESKNLQSKIEALERAKKFVSGETAKELKAASYRSMSQAEYQQQKEQLLG